MTSEEILADLRKIIRALNLESKRIQKELGISIPQLMCLNFLQKSPNYQAPVKSIAEALNLNPSTISGIVSRLEKKGYLARLPKRDDRRVTYITLTADGAKVIDQSPALFHDKLNTRLQNLSAIDQDKISEGLSLLTKLLGVEELDAAPVLTTLDNLASTTE